MTTHQQYTDRLKELIISDFMNNGDSSEAFLGMINSGFKGLDNFSTEELEDDFYEAYSHLNSVIDYFTESDISFENEMFLEFIMDKNNI